MSHFAVAICPSPSGVSYHRFPKNPKLRRLWKLACKRQDEFDEEKWRICSNHFSEDDFQRDLKNELLNRPLVKKLKPDVVPTLNLLPSSAAKRKSSSSLDREQRIVKKQRTELIDKLLQQGKVTKNVINFVIPKQNKESL